jgi:hypothetical protein
VGLKKPRCRSATAVRASARGLDAAVADARREDEVHPQRTSAPLPWSCDLLTDFFASVPLTLTNGTTFFDVLVPPGTWTLQAGTFGGTTIHMTNGVELVCR